MVSMVRKVRESNGDDLEEDEEFGNASEDNVRGSDASNENYMKDNNANNEVRIHM